MKNINCPECKSKAYFIEEQSGVAGRGTTYLLMRCESCEHEQCYFGDEAREIADA